MTAHNIIFDISGLIYNNESIYNKKSVDTRTNYIEPVCKWYNTTNHHNSEDLGYQYSQGGTNVHTFYK